MSTLLRCSAVGCASSFLSFVYFSIGLIVTITKYALYKRRITDFFQVSTKTIGNNNGTTGIVSFHVLFVSELLSSKVKSIKSIIGNKMRGKSFVQLHNYMAILHRRGQLFVPIRDIRSAETSIREY